MCSVNEMKSYRLMVLPILLLLCCDLSNGQSDGQQQDNEWKPVTEAAVGANGAEIQSAEQQVVQELSEEQRMGQALYEKALETLNDSKPDRASAFASLTQAAHLNHVLSLELVARAHLFGDDLPLDLDKAALMFKKLAAAGNPTAQLVSFLFL